FRCERFAEAKETFSRAARLEPNNPLALNGLALAMTGLKEFDGAVAAFEKSLALAPDNPTTYCNLATALLQAGDPQRALPIVRDAVARAPLDQSGIALLDVALRATGNPQADELNDYSAFVQVYDLDAPPGYSGMAAFNEDLNAYLDRFHADTREHF